MKGEVHESAISVFSCMLKNFAKETAHLNVVLKCAVKCVALDTSGVKCERGYKAHHYLLCSHSLWDDCRITSVDENVVNM